MLPLPWWPSTSWPMRSDKEKRMDWKDIAVRAGKTFVEAFLVLAPVEVVIGGDVPALKAAAVAAGAAAVSVVWNALLQWSRA